VNTSAEQTNTFALQNLTAALSTAGKAGIADGALSGDKLSDLGNGIHNDLTALSDKSSMDIDAAGKAVSSSVDMQGFNVTNAVKQLEQTMIAIQPQSPSLLGQILSAAVGAIGSAVANKYLRKGDDEDGGHDGGSIGSGGKGGAPSPFYGSFHHERGGTIKPGEWGVVGDVNKRGGELVYGGKAGVHVFNNNDSRNIFNNSHPREMTVRHTGHVELREPPRPNRGGYSTPRRG
jgi:hypothetical protein